MYEQFFGLTEKPFSIQPDPSFLYWGRTHRLAYAMLEYGVLNCAGISVITGEVGCGKTTLVHRLLDQLSDTHTVSLLSNVQQGRGDLLSWVLMGFGQPFAGKSHVEMFSQLQSFFISEYAKGKRVVLIIDEAQNLSADMLEELRLLSNINAGKDQLLQLILVGQPQLKDLLNKPELLQLAQRVGADFHLTPLTRQEVQAYVETRLAIAGCRRRIFTERAIDQVAEQSRGVPRVINIIADTALVYAFSAEDLVVGVETIRNVIRDKMEYGVFGLASDDVASPANSAPENGPDAFVREPSKTDAPDLVERPDTVKFDPHHEDRPRFQTPREAPEPKASRASSSPVTVAKTVADLKTIVQTRVEPIVQTAAVVERTEPLEESAVTGVIIVGLDKKISPEAAIRSAGDSRAVVFVSVGANRDANAIARKAGAIVVEENKQTLTTGGRARNAAYRQLKKIAPHIKFVQFLEADCALDPDWIVTAEKFMNRRAEVAIVEGHLRPAPGKSLAHVTIADLKRREIDGELQTTIGGSALMRTDQFEAVGGFRGDLLAAETADLCIRLRRRGGHIWRLEGAMLICNPTRRARKGWWSLAVKRGYLNAYAASLHGGPPERLGVMDVARAVFWGFVFPAAIFSAAGLGALGAAMFSPLTSAPAVASLILGFGGAVYILKILASIVRHGIFKPSSWGFAYCTVMGRFAEFFGVMGFWLGAKRPPHPAQ
jgi:general secretion pathway protein A